MLLFPTATLSHFICCSEVLIYRFICETRDMTVKGLSDSITPTGICQPCMWCQISVIYLRKILPLSKTCMTFCITAYYPKFHHFRSMISRLSLIKMQFIQCRVEICSYTLTSMKLTALVSNYLGTLCRFRDPCLF